MLAFFMVLLRLSAFLVAWPVFSLPMVPAPVKILIALTLTLVIFPVVEWKGLAVELESLEIVWLALREIFIGVSIGFLARTFFFAMQVGGEIMSTSMGLASGQLFNPEMGGTVTATEQFQVAIATLFFLAINGHHFFLSGMADSFQLVPLSSAGLSLKGLKETQVILQLVVEMGLKFAAPVMIAVLFMNITMAVIGRAVPQINVLITSLPVNILVGLIIFLTALPLMLWQMHDLLEVTTSRVFHILKSY